MRVMVFNHSSKEAKNAEKTLEKYGHTISKSPEIIITIGGDGTFLLAERELPGVPKVLIRSKNRLCIKCSNYSIEEVAKALSEKQFTVEEFYKVEGTVGKQKIVGLNEISVRNKDPRVALRFELKIGDKIIGEFIGDGVVVATPFGSSAYFYSITGQIFSSGLGVALNNTSKKMSPIHANEEVKVKILRESATVSCDNGKILHAKTGDTITIKKSDSVARIIAL